MKNAFLMLVFSLFAIVSTAASISITAPGACVSAQSGDSISIVCSNGTALGVPANPGPVVPVTQVSQPAGGDTCAAQGLRNSLRPLTGAMGDRTDIDLGPNESASFPLIVSAEMTSGQFAIIYTSGGSKAISISEKMCDFSQERYAAQCLTLGAQSPSLQFQTTTPPIQRCALVPGRQYYINVRNTLSSRIPVFPLQDGCTIGPCRVTYSFFY